MPRKRPNRIHLDLNLLGSQSLETLEGIIANEMQAGYHDKKGYCELAINRASVAVAKKGKIVEERGDS